MKDLGVRKEALKVVKLIYNRILKVTNSQLIFKGKEISPHKSALE